MDRIPLIAKPGDSMEDMKKANEQAAAQRDADRKLTIELGRYFEASIEEFIKAHGDIKGQIVVAAATYLNNLYTERMTALMLKESEMYGSLKKKIDELGLKLHEPFSNDGIESVVRTRPDRGE